MATQHMEQSTTVGFPNSSSTPEGRPVRSGRVRAEEVQPPRKSPTSIRSLTHSPFFCGALYEQMSEDLSLAGMSERTHEGYLRAVRKLADFYQQSPDQITESQLRKYFLHLKNDRKFASETGPASGKVAATTRSSRVESQTRCFAGVAVQL